MSEEESQVLYDQVLARLQEKNISTEDYELLLQLENKHKNNLPLNQFCALALQKEFKAPECDGSPRCSYCGLDIIDKDDTIQLKNCPHFIHKTQCLASNFDAVEGESEQNKCKTCRKPLLDGLEEALKVPKLINKVTVKINKSTDRKKATSAVIHEMQEKC
jgi:hypothetical protein